MNNNLIYNSNYCGYDIWEYTDTEIGAKYYVVFISGVSSNYEKLSSAKAAINLHIIDLNKRKINNQKQK